MVNTPEGLEAVKERLIKQIEVYDFLGNYNYAYLINELAVKSITEWAVQETVRKLN